MVWYNPEESVWSEATIYGTATSTVRQFYERLVDAAEKLTSDRDADAFSFASAISLTGTACEVAAGTAAQTIVEKKGHGPVGEAAISWIRQFNLADDRVRRIWNAIASDAIQDEPFWNDFQKHVHRRNDVVHTGTTRDVPGNRESPFREVTKADAEESINAARKLIEHIMTVLGS